ncbi:hypothetical protein GH714_025697 [Hevea brasiliensis]|uniref:Reverse transcriptase Ty1/copia-type domain-containing protein n=1 Tax=Hevea brasiliensis TaxID=3981 RepID=A0A6A6NJ36_HEVBR|nr:hypothetical protein GH714_025697 [Hevea brasiliensis]
MDEAESSTLKKTDEWKKEISNAVKQEVMKYLKGKMTMDDNSHNFSGLVGFAGMADVNCFLGDDSSWTGNFFLSQPIFSSSYLKFFANVSMIHEPTNYSQAKSNPQWLEAMRKELQALEDNGMWEIADLPSHKRAIDSKLIYKLKYKPDGSVKRYKAWLVTKGYNQLPGLDYTASFSSVTKIVTIRILLA